MTNRFGRYINKLWVWHTSNEFNPSAACGGGSSNHMNCNVSPLQIDGKSKHKQKKVLSLFVQTLKERINFSRLTSLCSFLHFSVVTISWLSRVGMVSDLMTLGGGGGALNKPSSLWELLSLLLDKIAWGQRHAGKKKKGTGLIPRQPNLLNDTSTRFYTAGYPAKCTRPY